MYNHGIRHSGIGKKTPIEKLREYYENRERGELIEFKRYYEEFIEYDNYLFNHSKKHDNV